MQLFVNHEGVHDHDALALAADAEQIELSFHHATANTSASEDEALITPACSSR